MNSKTVGAMLKLVEESKLYRHPDGRVPTVKEMLDWVNEDKENRMQWITWAYTAALDRLATGPGDLNG